MVHGEKKSPGIQSWPPLVGGAEEVLQHGLPKPCELAGPLCEFPVVKSMLLNVNHALFSRLDLK